MNKKKNIKQCEIESCKRSFDKYRVSYWKRYEQFLCFKHYCQLKQYGQILKHTRFDPNEIIIYDNYAEIVLYNIDKKEIARIKIDIKDIEKVRQYKWVLSHKYAATHIKNNKIKRMHQILIGDMMDHIDGDTLNNCRKNLRQCNKQENSYNSKLHNTNTSGVRGVCWYKQTSRWTAFIYINKKPVGLGYFKNKRDAAIARLKAERKHYKEFQNKMLEKQTMKKFNIIEEELI